MIKILLFLFICIFSYKSFSNEVQILNEIIGKGSEVKNHSKVSVHYIGKLEDNTIFDSSYDRGQLFDFQIGVRQVILGWETGLLGMKEGGKRTIFIPDYFCNESLSLLRGTDAKIIFYDHSLIRNKKLIYYSDCST